MASDEQLKAQSEDLIKRSRDKNLKTEDNKNGNGNVLKWMKTFVLYGVFLGLGICCGLVPSTFLDLRDQLGVDTSIMSFAYTVQYAGTLAGGIAAGFIIHLNCIDEMYVLSVSLLGVAATLVSVPWFYKVGVVMVFLGASGVFNGIADAVTNLSIIHVWGEKSGPYLQGMHLMHAFGIFLTPVLSGPFLSERRHDFNSSFNVFSNASAKAVNDTKIMDGNVGLSINAMTESNIRYVYMIVGMYVGVSGLVVCFCRIAGSFIGNESSAKSERDLKNMKETDARKISRYFKIKFLILLFVLLFLYNSLQSTNGGLLLVFVVQGLYWSKQQGTFLVSAFWISFSFARLIGIPIFASKIISVGQLLAINLLLITSSSIVLAIFAESHFIVTWITMLVSGLGQGTLLIAIIVWYQQNIMPVTGVVTSIVTAAVSSGAISTPLLTGYLVEKVNFMCFPYVLAALSVLVTGLTLFICGLVKLHNKGNTSKAL